MRNLLRYMKWLSFVLLILLPCLSMQPQQQNLSALMPASTMTLQGQQIAQATIDDTRTDEDVAEAPIEEQQQQEPVEQQATPPPPQQEQVAQPQQTTQSQPQQPQATEPPKQTLDRSPAPPQANVTTALPSTQPQTTTPPTDAPVIEDSPNVVVKDDAEDVTAYFETNVYDGQIVTTADYVIAITH
ncbi:MAG: hypothetical protein UHX00_14405, partial [Caryophanon sp.]|nr:hypothetical protein [Caryophanon sp.]